MLSLPLFIRRAPRVCWLLIGLPLAVFGSSCTAPSITAGLGMAQLATEGSFGATDSGAVVTSSMKSLGLDQEETAILPRVFLRDGRRALELSGFQVDYEGQGVVESTITMNGTTLLAGTAVDSQFGMGAYSGVLTWDVASFGSSKLGLGFGLEWINLDVGLDETAGALSLRSNQQFPLPLIGVRLSSEDSPVSGSMNVGYISLSAPEATATVLDVDARVDVRLRGRKGGTLVLGMLGYRNFDMDVSYDDGGSQIEADFQIGGPYVGLRISF
ncbi:MAG: hypothetical protein P1V35_08275 [Planctomycetota bacterium]|nr:hypothetical protein [Planctomycetota bacterium]